MDIEAINKLMAMLPEGEKKEALRKKFDALNNKSKKRGGDGLHDSFEFKPKGHIKIEAINETGDVVGTLADQPNLVLDGAEEILLRAFSGDPNRILYKNRVPKQSPTTKFYVEEAKLEGSPLFDNGQLQHDPNVLWSGVDDSKFDVTYGYYPVTMYVKEEVSTEFAKKAFSISSTPAAGYVPMNAELYSTYTNMFIGLGEGKSYDMQLTDSRLTYSEGFSPANGVAKTIDEGHSIKIREKISHFSFDYEASNNGAQIDVIVNGVLQETVDAYDADLENAEIRTYEINALNSNEETEVQLLHSGSEGLVNPEMSITVIRIDALDKSMTRLMKEFKSYETTFSTPTVFNTTPMGPYTIQLPNFPLEKDSVKVTYNEMPFSEVKTEDELAEDTFMVDDLHGIVRFNRALTGVMLTYSISGEIYDNELVSTMTNVPLTVSTTSDSPFSETPSGIVDGANKSFVLSKQNIKEGSIIVKVNNVAVAVANTDLSAKKVTLETAPAVGEAVLVEYVYGSVSSKQIQVNKYATKHEITTDSVRVFDQAGVELVSVSKSDDFKDGSFMIDPSDKKGVLIAQKNAAAEVITKAEVVYKSPEKPGIETNYTRAVIEKPKSLNAYPWFELDKGSVQFVAEFPELKPSHNVIIREMGLFDGPRAEDKIAGFRNFPVKAFSMVRVGETRKDTNTGIRITWTITLLNENSQPFQGGRS